MRGEYKSFGYESMGVQKESGNQWWTWFALPVSDADRKPIYYFYPLPEEGRLLFDEYLESDKDRTIGGVFADWLEDHWDDLLCGAIGPSDPSVRLRELIDHLRDRFRKSFENAT